MGDWPKLQITRVAQDDISPGSYPTGWYTTVTAGGTLHTKGAYVQLVAAAPVDVAGILLAAGITATGATRLLDLAVGGSGSEQVVLPDFPLQNTRSGSSMDLPIFIPIKIPRGSRIAARCQASSGSAVVQVKLNLIADGLAGFQGATRWAAYGADLAASAGSVIQADSGGVNGPFTQLVAAAPFTSRFAYLCMHNGGSDDYTFDFALGTQPVWQNIRNSMQQSAPAVFVPWYIPRGSQVQCRVRSVNGVDLRGMVIVGG